MKAFIDWLAFTDHKKKRKKIITILNYNIKDLRKTEKGMLGYKKLELLNEIKLLSEGGAEMGEHYIMSSTSLRLLEKEISLVKMLGDLRGEKVNFTRIDLAIDIKQTRSFNINLLKKDIIKGNVISKWKTSKEIIERKVSDGTVTGNTIYLGSRTSNVMLRIYDKFLESGIEDYRDIMRLELEIKREYSENAIYQLLNGQVGQVIKEILNNYIRVVEPSNDKNKSRWKTATYWEKFIESLGKIQLSNGVLEKTMEDKINWFSNQIAPSFALIYTAEPNILADILNEGYSRLNKKDLNILDTYLKSKKA